MKAGLETFPVDEFVEDGEDLAAEGVDAAGGFAELAVVVGVGDPLFKDGAGDGDVAAEFVGAVAAEEEAVEHGGLALDGEGVEVVAGLEGAGRLDG